MEWDKKNRVLRLEQPENKLIKSSIFKNNIEVSDLVFQHRSERTIPPISSVPVYVMLLNKMNSASSYWTHYRQLSELLDDIESQYVENSIPKKSGGVRKVYRVRKQLRSHQRWILENILSEIPIPECATAYKKGARLTDNAKPHVRHKQMLQLDIEHFFDSISFSQVYGAIAETTEYPRPVVTVLTRLCTLNGHLPQGACTSPALSNMVMRHFDWKVSRYCENHGIDYTRYCDDMTFSADYMDTGDVLRFVRSELGRMHLAVNDKKTKICGPGNQHKVTGIVCNEQLHIPGEYKRKIRQEMYFLQKYGVDRHLKRMGDKQFLRHGRARTRYYLSNLRGRINYVIGVEPYNTEFLEYQIQLKKLTT